MSQRLGVFGGTFDPVHIGHLILGEAGREQLNLDRVIFVPTGHPWRKPDHQITPAPQRLEMLRLVLADNPRFEASTLEIDREGPTYSEMTLSVIHEANPKAELFFLLGRDALADLPNWHDPSAVVSLATLAMANREGEALAASDDPALARLNARIVDVQMPAIGVSSTGIRDRVADGRSIRYLVPDAVAEYIDSHGLYQR